MDAAVGVPDAPLAPKRDAHEYVAENVTVESRLACQIVATEIMDGVVLRVAT